MHITTSRKQQTTLKEVEKAKERAINVLIDF